MSLHRLLIPLDQELERRDQRLDLLQRQLTTAYERADYVRADALSDAISKARAEWHEFQRSRDALAIMIDALEPPAAEA